MPNLEMPIPKQFLKVVEVTELLKVKPRTMYEMVAQNCIPYRKPPGSNILRFELEDNLCYRYLLPDEEPRLMAEIKGPRAHLKPG